MRVILNTERCEGHGLCMESAPGVFEADDDGYSVVKSEHPAEAQWAAARAAADACPMQAITIAE